MKKKSARKKLKEKLEKKVKAYVKLRDNYTCQYCKQKLETNNCHASHVIPVSRDGRLAFDDLNLKVLCFHDHINGWHKHPVEFGKWFTKQFPDRWKYLEKEHNENRTKGTIQMEWLKDQLTHYTKLVNEFDPDSCSDIKTNDLKYIL